jgi:dienelactone hydrolase
MKTDLPKPTGRFAVGRASVEITDDSRTDALALPDAEGPRRLIVWVWYPAIHSSASPYSPYLPGGWEASDTVMGASLGTTSLQSHSQDGAAPLLERGPFPLLIFSGSGFSPLSYAGLLEELASHGYVVASICHTHDAPITVFEDGSVVLADETHLRRITAAVGDPVAGGMEETFSFRAEVALLKRDDIASTAKLLSETDAPLSDTIDTERVGSLGHSLGGNAALEWCRTDARCRAAANLDGAIWTDVGTTGLAKPAMVVAAEHPEMLASPEQLVAAGAFPSVEWCVQERNYLFDRWQRISDSGNHGTVHTIGGARHANFADVQFVQLPDDAPMRRVLGPIAPEQMWRSSSQLLLDFFGTHLQ